MHVEINGTVKFKPYGVLKENLLTGEIKRVQDFDTEEEARRIAEKSTDGFMLGTYHKHLGMGVSKISITMDSQTDEAEWRRRHNKGDVILPPKVDAPVF